MKQYETVRLLSTKGSAPVREGRARQYVVTSLSLFVCVHGWRESLGIRKLAPLMVQCGEREFECFITWDQPPLERALTWHLSLPRLLFLRLWCLQLPLYSLQ